MFINVSNHPSAKWSAEQLAAAGGQVVDIQHPVVDPELDENELFEFARDWYQANVEPILPRESSGMVDHGITVHLMGEAGLCAVLARLLGPRVKIVHSTTARDVVEDSEGTKTVRFRFVRFRQTGFVPEGGLR